MSFQCVDRGTASENTEGTMSHNALPKFTDYPLRYPFQDYLIALRNAALKQYLSLVENRRSSKKTNLI